VFNGQRSVSGAGPAQEDTAFRSQPLTRLADNPLFSLVRRSHGNRSGNYRPILPQVKVQSTGQPHFPETSPGQAASRDSAIAEGCGLSASSCWADAGVILTPCHPADATSKTRPRGN
jgi:hypothetical protein